MSITALLAVLVFFASLKHGFIGLLLMILLSLPMVMYQVPALAEIYIIAMSMAMIYGYMHHRTIAFLYILVTLPFSVLGAILSIPFFIFSILIVGHKRAAAIAVLAVFAIVMLSGLTGIQNTGFIPYTPAISQQGVLQNPFSNYTTPTRPAPQPLQLRQRHGLRLLNSN